VGSDTFLRKVGLILENFILLITVNILTDIVEVSPSSEYTSCAVTKEFLKILGTHGFKTVSTRALDRFPTCARSIQFIPLHRI
jgi:hypothetical protein